MIKDNDTIQRKEAEWEQELGAAVCGLKRMPGCTERSKMSTIPRGDIGWSPRSCLCATRAGRVSFLSPSYFLVYAIALDFSEKGKETNETFWH